MYRAWKLLRFDPARCGSAVKMRCCRRASSGEGIALNFSSTLIWRAAEDGVKPKILSSEKVGATLARIRTESRSKKFLRVIEEPPIQGCRARYYSALRDGGVAGVGFWLGLTRWAMNVLPAHEDPLPSPGR